MENEKKGFIRCVHPKKGVDYFRKETAEKKSWQMSTGWTPQPLEPLSATITESFLVENEIEQELVAEIPSGPIGGGGLMGVEETPIEQPKNKGGRPKNVAPLTADSINS